MLQIREEHEKKKTAPTLKRERKGEEVEKRGSDSREEKRNTERDGEIRE